MKIEVFYHYAKHDTDYTEDCYESEVYINGKKIDLPFEEDYPKDRTETFIEGIKLGVGEDGELLVLEKNLADLEY